MTHSNWPGFVLSQVWSLPTLLVAVAAILIAVIRWRRHPVVSLLTIAAFLVLILRDLLWVGVQVWQLAAEPSFESVQPVYTVVRCINLLLSVVIYTLLITAIFGWRSSPTPFNKGY